MQALADAPPARKRYEAQRWQLLQHARDVKARKACERRLAAEASAAKRSKRVVSDITAAFRVVATALGLPSQTKPRFDDGRALLSMRLARAPAIRTQDLARRAQDSASVLFAATCLKVQAAFVERTFGPHIVQDDDAMDGAVGTALRVVNVLEWQWDETSQRSRGMKCKILK